MNLVVALNGAGVIAAMRGTPLHDGWVGACGFVAAAVSVYGAWKSAAPKRS